MIGSLLLVGQLLSRCWLLSAVSNQSASAVRSGKGDTRGEKSPTSKATSPVMSPSIQNRGRDKDKQSVFKLGRRIQNLQEAQEQKQDFAIISSDSEDHFIANHRDSIEHEAQNIMKLSTPRKINPFADPSDEEGSPNWRVYCPDTPSPSPPRALDARGYVSAGAHSRSALRPVPSTLLPGREAHQKSAHPSRRLQEGKTSASHHSRSDAKQSQNPIPQVRRAQPLPQVSGPPFTLRPPQFKGTPPRQLQPLKPVLSLLARRNRPPLELVPIPYGLELVIGRIHEGRDNKSHGQLWMQLGIEKLQDPFIDTDGEKTHNFDTNRRSERENQRSQKDKTNLHKAKKVFVKTPYPGRRGAKPLSKISIPPTHTVNVTARQKSISRSKDSPVKRFTPQKLLFTSTPARQTDPIKIRRNPTPESPTPMPRKRLSVSNANGSKNRNISPSTPARKEKNDKVSPPAVKDTSMGDSPNDSDKDNPNPAILLAGLRRKGEPWPPTTPYRPIPPPVEESNGNLTDSDSEYSQPEGEAGGTRDWGTPSLPAWNHQEEDSPSPRHTAKPLPSKAKSAPTMTLRGQKDKKQEHRQAVIPPISQLNTRGVSPRLVNSSGTIIQSEALNTAQECFHTFSSDIRYQRAFSDFVSDADDLLNAIQSGRSIDKWKEEERRQKAASEARAKSIWEHRQETERILTGEQHVRDYYIPNPFEEEEDEGSEVDNLQRGLAMKVMDHLLPASHRPDFETCPPCTLTMPVVSTPAVRTMTRSPLHQTTNPDEQDSPGQACPIARQLAGYVITDDDEHDEDGLLASLIGGSGYESEIEDQEVADVQLRRALFSAPIKQSYPRAPPTPVPQIMVTEGTPVAENKKTSGRSAQQVGSHRRSLLTIPPATPTKPSRTAVSPISFGHETATPLSPTKSSRSPIVGTSMLMTSLNKSLAASSEPSALKEKAEDASVHRQENQAPALPPVYRGISPRSGQPMTARNQAAGASSYVISNSAASTSLIDPFGPTTTTQVRSALQAFNANTTESETGRARTKLTLPAPINSEDNPRSTIRTRSKSPVPPFALRHSHSNTSLASSDVPIEREGTGVVTQRINHWEALAKEREEKIKEEQERVERLRPRKRGRAFL